ncbi:MAG: HPF/RaiA family ribosome-associated protein [Betaproteobacteria bacterium]|nr:HPF/RaiA family ribosome-associated protein [Betaproteobacteria bacterium]
MEVPLQVTVRNLPHSEALEARIRKKAAKLEEFHPRITSCRVTVEELRKHQHQGRQFQVSVDVRVPGREVVANLARNEDVYVALRDAFDGAKRQLEEVARQTRGDVKDHEVPQLGRIARLFAEERYGFVVTEDGRELYFSSTNVVHPAFERLAVGDEVQFIEELAAEGPQAKRVSVGKHHALA